MLGDAGEVGGDSVVGPALGRVQQWVEAFGVEVAIVDLVAAAPQRRDDRLVQRRGEAVAQRMRVDDEDAHPAADLTPLLEAVAQHFRKAHSCLGELRLHRGERLGFVLGADLVEVDRDTAADRLEVRLPDAQIMVMRVGSRYITRFGAGRGKRAA